MKNYTTPGNPHGHIPPSPVQDHHLGALLDAIALVLFARQQVADCMPVWRMLNHAIARFEEQTTIALHAPEPEPTIDDTPAIELEGDCGITGCFHASLEDAEACRRAHETRDHARRAVEHYRNRQQ